jgi:hypothetical protein
MTKRPPDTFVYLNESLTRENRELMIEAKKLRKQKDTAIQDTLLKGKCEYVEMRMIEKLLFDAVMISRILFKQPTTSTFFLIALIITNSEITSVSNIVVFFFCFVYCLYIKYLIVIYISQGLDLIICFLPTILHLFEI